MAQSSRGQLDNAPTQDVLFDSSTGTSEPSSLQEIDLLNPDDDGDEGNSPPGYGDAYGEVSLVKDGASALIADDGRVNIRINRFSRSLAQIVAPAFDQQTKTAEDDAIFQTTEESARPPYHRNASRERPSAPPKLNIVIHIVGSRGDVQPFVALGKELRDMYGHRVRLATHPQFRDFVREHGLEFFSIGGDPSRLMAFMAKNPSLVPGFRSIASGDISERRKDVSEYIQGCWRSCYEAGDGIYTHSPTPETDSTPFVADCIIANPPSFAHVHCAEKLGVPLHIMFTMPYSPTRAFPHPLANIRSSDVDPQLTNFLSYALIEILSWQGIGDIMNRFRRKCLKLHPVSSISAPGMLHRLNIPHTYCWSPALIPKPKDWRSHISIAGFYFLPSPNYTPPPDLQAFLDRGSTPIYIGFGSIVLDDPQALTELVLDAVRQTGQRVLLSKGWGGIGIDGTPDSVFMLGNVPHDWLFKQVTCVVHHGGAGTTSAGISAGRPTVVVPFFGDQPFWGSMIARAGAGPDPIPFKQLTAQKLAQAIEFCLRPETALRAGELASRIATERGVEDGARAFHHHLDLNRLRCALASRRAAAWRVKFGRSKVNLSAFAVCTLVNAGLLDVAQLKLFRAQEYDTEAGPLDPISGAFTSAVRAINGLAMGLAEIPTETWRIPTETWKAVRSAKIPVARRSERSTVPASLTSGASSMVCQNASSTQLASSQASEVGATLGDRRDSIGVCSSICVTPKAPGEGSSSANAVYVQHSTPRASRQTFDDHSRVRNRVESGHGRDRDALRRPVPHTSKGVGRLITSLLQVPVNILTSLTQGCHNLPKLWKDTTVRPQERVKGMKSGLRAVGREFGFGWYDGLSGLVTHPLKGAQTNGASGFFSGIGKGVGGVIVKPSAAFLGILSHTFEGVYREVGKLFSRGDLDSYIAASRLAQGYKEWLESSTQEKDEVITRWRDLHGSFKGRDDLRLESYRTQADQENVGGFCEWHEPTIAPVRKVAQTGTTSGRIVESSPIDGALLPQHTEMLKHELSNSNSGASSTSEATLETSIEYN